MNTTSRPRATRRLASVLFTALSLLALCVLPNNAVGQTQRDSTALDWLHVGDRIIVSVQGERALTDTFTVHDGLVLKLPTLPDILLQGVARSDLQSRVATAVGELYRDREVHVSALVRVGVLGQVVRPGYYQLSVDAPISDALMAAGGPTPAASPDKIEVHRAGKTLIEPKEVRELLASGATLIQANVRAGDDIVVLDRQAHDWSSFAQIAATASSVLVSVMLVLRR